MEIFLKTLVYTGFYYTAFFWMQQSEITDIIKFIKGENPDPTGFLLDSGKIMGKIALLYIAHINIPSIVKKLL